MYLRCHPGLNIREGQCLWQPTVQRVLENNKSVFIKGHDFLKGCSDDIRALDKERQYIHIIGVFMKRNFDLRLLHIYCKDCSFSWFVRENGNWKVNYRCKKPN